MPYGQQEAMSVSLLTLMTGCCPYDRANARAARRQSLRAGTAEIQTRRNPAQKCNKGKGNTQL